MTPDHPLLTLLTDLGSAARTVVAHSLIHSTSEDRSARLGHAGSDVIFALDQKVEKELVRILEERAGDLGGIVLIAEGIGEEEKTHYPADWTEEDCAWRLLMDPIDGTRGIMMDKRSAWFIAAAAPNHGEHTRLAQSECAVLTELPNSRAGLADEFTAVKGRGIRGKRTHLYQPERTHALDIQPWSGNTIYGGFAQISQFFPCGRTETAALEEALWQRLFPDAGEGEVLGYGDQYISTGGQWVELLMGRDRFCADLRPLLYNSPLFKGKRRGLTCHPYDMAGLLILQEAGLALTDAHGLPLDAPFDTRSECSWIAYANPDIRKQVEPVLHGLLKERGWTERKRPVR